MKTETSRLTKNLIDMGKNLRDVGLIDKESFSKIKIRLLKKEKLPKGKLIKREKAKCLFSQEWPELESNQRHKDFQSSALPTELSGHRMLCKLHKAR